MDNRFFDCVVFGTPVSFQSKNSARKKAWQQAVVKAVAAVGTAPGAPVTHEVEVRITHFCDGFDPNNDPDVDNIIKLIQDALCSVIFVDDSQVVDTSARRRDINGAYKIKGVSPHVALALSSGDEFVWIEVGTGPDKAVLV